MSNDFLQNAVNNLYRDNELMALKAENARLKAEVDAHKKYISEWAFGDYVPVTEVTRLKAEVERLTKAGDGLGEWVADYLPEKKAWNAAKQGGQP